MTVKMLFGWLQPAKPVQAPSPKHDLKAAAKDLCEAKVNQPQIVLAKANQPNGMATTTEQSLVKAAKQPLVKAKKAFRNDVFMGSERARPIRVLCEYEETMQRLANENVESTIMFFGSARSKFEDEYKAAVVNARASGNETDLVRLNATAWMCPYMQKVRKLAAACTSWAMERSDITGDPPVLVCTGGGPGFMEAANRGAADVPGGRSIGMGITLPFESGLNPYVTPELAFEYHYFFMRKFWMTFNMRALVVAPGGFGTMDELFELLTLKQTGKIERTFPIVLFGKQYWKDVLNWKVRLARSNLRTLRTAHNRISPLS